MSLNISISPQAKKVLPPYAVSRLRNVPPPGLMSDGTEFIFQVCLINVSQFHKSNFTFLSMLPQMDTFDLRRPIFS